MKVAILYSFKMSYWKSCQTIVGNIKKSYEELLDGYIVKYFDFNSDQNCGNIYNLAEDIYQYNPDKIIFIDHRPNPSFLLKCLMNKKEKLFKPDILFHVYGDFVLNLSEWYSMEESLENLKVKFLCASDKQVGLLQKLIMNKKSVVKIPFPVDPKIFFFDHTIRQNYREKMQFKDDVIVYLYTGRISLQKRVIDVVESFVKIVNSTGVDSRLILAGSFDDIGVPYLDQECTINTYYQFYQSFISGLDQSIQDKIIYVGDLDHFELNKVYNGSDIFFSMSMHNDEDFGMSPAESLSTGSRAVLTDWAGYSSFYLKEIDIACRLIPVEFTLGEFVFNKKRLLKILLTAQMSYKYDQQLREKISFEYQSYCSINSVSKKINATFTSTESQSFFGFSSLMKEIALQNNYFGSPFVQEKQSFNHFYKQLYESYIK